MGIPVRFVSCLARFDAALVVTTPVAMGSGAYAQDLDPRAYANAPVGLNFLWRAMPTRQAVWRPIPRYQ
jgi:hypothetical protein